MDVLVKISSDSGRKRYQRCHRSPIRMMVERSLENNQEVYICFVDYAKAFDRVDWKKLINIMRKKGVDWRNRRLIGNLYMGKRSESKYRG